MSSPIVVRQKSRMSKPVILELPDLLTIGDTESHMALHSEITEYTIPSENNQATIVTAAGVDKNFITGLFVNTEDLKIVVNPEKDNQLYDMFYPVISGNFSSPQDPSKIVTSYEWVQTIIYDKIVTELFSPVVFAGADLTKIITINTDVAAQMTNGFITALRDTNITKNLYRQMFAQDPGRFLGRDQSIAIPFADGDQINFLTKVSFSETVFVPSPGVTQATPQGMFDIREAVPSLSFTPSPIFLTTGVKIGQ